MMMMMMMSNEKETNCRNQFDGIPINICRLMMLYMRGHQKLSFMSFDFISFPKLYFLLFIGFCMHDR